MGALVTDAIVLHAFDYLESSRIVRLITRDGGVRSALARGARRSTRRFGTALDLFVHGVAELDLKGGRDLDVLSNFDVRRSRTMLAAELARFAGASVIAELTIRFGGHEADPLLFEVVAEALDRLTVVEAAQARSEAIAGSWRVLAAAGFSPALDSCTNCHADVPLDANAVFRVQEGGVLCEACGRSARRPAGRNLPGDARATILRWLDSEQVVVTEQEARAHQRLLREFAEAHVADSRPLRAYEMWEHAAWSAA